MKNNKIRKAVKEKTSLTGLAHLPVQKLTKITGKRVGYLSSLQPVRLGSACS